MTYSGATMNKIWKKYVAGLPIPSIFLHKNEFEKAYPNVAIKYPAVLLKSGESFNAVLRSEDFDKLKDLGDLIGKLSDRLPNAKGVTPNGKI
jgi:hypothetical protein